MARTGLELDLEKKVAGSTGTGSSHTGHSNPAIRNSLCLMRIAKQTAVLVGERPPKRLAKYTLRDDRVLSSSNRHGVLPIVDFLELIMDT